MDSPLPGLLLLYISTKPTLSCGSPLPRLLDNVATKPTLSYGQSASTSTVCYVIATIDVEADCPCGQSASRSIVAIRINKT